MAQFVKFNSPDEIYDAVKALLQKASKSGKIKKGVNEVTKAVERSQAKLVVMAEDVSPEELLLHLPVLCKEKKIPFAYLKERKALGEAVSLKIATSCVAVVDAGSAEKDLSALIKQISELSK